MSDNYRHLIDKAQEAIDEGDRSAAQLILANLIKLSPGNEQAWWLLAKVVDDKDKTVYCLKQVVKINPENESARRSLQVLERPSLDQRLARTGGAVAPFTRETDESSQQERFSRPAEAPQAVSGAATPSVLVSPRVEPRLGRVSGIESEADADLESVRPSRRWNWPLYLGLFILVVIAFLSIAGPSLAPRDPLEENIIIRVGDGWDIPPFAFLTPGFPLGSDEFGRDIFSRLLIGIRPTMIMVLIVAVVRLLLGMLNGLIAGWSSSWLARAMNNLIEGALSIPVLLVALGAIAVVGVEWGIWAFIIGLSLTGWVETAQQVREQTRIIKSQAYVEAAQALGASNRQILIGHILRQILPMSLMLFAFEMSSTLMTTAGLGFLGYYIGGDVWIEVGDFVAQRVSGQPELGQMLATSWTTLTQPWGMVAVGSTVFLAVLGFNLTGEGLRHNMDLTIVKRHGIIARMSEKAGLWLDQNVWYPVSGELEKPVVRTALTGLMIAVILVGAAVLLWPRLQSWIASRPEPSGQASLEGGVPAAGAPSPGDETESPGATSTPRITYDPQVVWEFDVEEGGFLSGPAHSPDGSAIYAVTENGLLYALSMAGEELWQLQLPSDARGTPAVDDAGNLYITDPDAALFKISPEGELLWSFQSTAAPMTSAGPVLDTSGVIYYTVTTGGRGFVQAVTGDGEGFWSSEGTTAALYDQVGVGVDGEYVFLKNVLIDAHTGLIIQPETDLNVLRYFPGEDGHNYLVSGNNIIRWELNGGRLEVVEVAEWDHSELSQSTAPRQVGVLPNGTTWMMYTSPGGNSNTVWVTMEDKFLGSAAFEVSAGQMLVMQPYMDGFECGGRSFQPEYVKCAVIYPGADQPRWEIDLGSPGEVQGGFWLDQRLYLTTAGGALYVVEANLSQEQAGDAQSGDASNTVAPGESGVVWRYQYPEQVDSISMKISDTGVYVLNESADKLIIVGPDGQPLNTLTLDPPLYRLEGSRDLEQTLTPSILPDGTIVVIDENLLVYGMNLTGDRLWVFTLENRPKYQPFIDPLGRLVVLDVSAGVTVFENTGFLWHFQSAAAEHTAATPTFAPDGTIYFVPTSFSTGYVQAVSPDGEGLWVTKAATTDFYHTPQLSSDGDFVFLQDNVFDAQTGELLPVEFPAEVDRIFIGLDGRAYFSSDANLYGFELTRNALTITSETSWVSRHQPFVFVDANDVIWSYQDNMLVWLSLDGEVLGTQPEAFSRSSELTYSDLEKSRRVVCDQESSTQTLACTMWSAGSSEPIWETTLEDIPSFSFAYLNEDKFAYLISYEDELVKLYIDYPE